MREITALLKILVKPLLSGLLGVCVVGSGLFLLQKADVQASTDTSDHASISEHEARPTSLNQKRATYAHINTQALPAGTQADRVYVDKSERRMDLLKSGMVIRRYHIALGDSPKGHKVQEGDEKTPEGIYTLDWKNENSIAHRSIHISYPNKKDQQTVQNLGVSAGGAIMIHGQMNGYGHLAPVMQTRDWTDGCIAVADDEMDEIMDLVPVGTEIEIVW